MAMTSIAVSQETKALLATRGSKGETFEQIIRRLLETSKKAPRG